VFPGILELSQDDQLILIKMSFFEMWLTRMARMFSQEDNVVTFDDGSMIQKDELAVVYSVSINYHVHLLARRLYCIFYPSIRPSIRPSIC